MSSINYNIKEKKSFLREKWEIFFLKIVEKRILDFESQKEKILFIKGKDDLNKVINNGMENKNYRFVVISTPLNNFALRTHFLSLGASPRISHSPPLRA